MSKPIVAFDIDGVIIDFMGSFIPYVNLRLGKNITYDQCRCHNFAEVFGISEFDASRIYDDYKNEVSHDELQPIDGALDGLGILKNHYQIAIITSRSPHYEEITYQWFKHNSPVEAIHFSLGRNNPYAGHDGRKHKPQIAEQIGALCLIEDNEEEFIHWDAPTVQPICFAQPWNECLVESHPKILRLNGWSEITDLLLKSPV